VVLRIRTILHPTDFSERSTAALRLAWSLARDHGARLILLHAVPPTEDSWLQADLKELHGKLEQLPLSGTDVVVERQLIQELPASAVLRVATETNCDLIVMGTHGRTGLGRALMGSVAEQVVRRASCPVLTVKMPFVEREGPGIRQ
jgi:nucleotide-binding universal stress UspA family protein